MPPKRAREEEATDADLLPEAPKPWTETKPKGLFILPKGISPKTCRDAHAFFNTPNFPWEQRWGKRFPKTAHFNNYRIGPFEGEDARREFEEKFPAVYALAHEATNQMREYLRIKDPDGAFEHFQPESVNVHKHEPGWGLGAHYDDTHDVGHGMVLMVSIYGKEDVDRPRKFLFTDPVHGKQYTVETPNRQVLCFMREAYDFWRHESLRKHTQSDTCLSLTIRLKSIDGYVNFADDRKYPKGAPAAAMWAHKRIRAGRAIIRAWRRMVARRAAAAN